MDAIMERADAYFSTLSCSISTARDDFKFGGNAISLCECLVSGTYSSEELKSFVQSMYGIALSMKGRAIEIFENFSQVQADLVEVREMVALTCLSGINLRCLVRSMA
jgi:hypothetical protein